MALFGSLLDFQLKILWTVPTVLSKVLKTWKYLKADWKLTKQLLQIRLSNSPSFLISSLLFSPK